MTRFRLFTLLLMVLAGCLGLAIGFGFVGKVHGAFDSFSHFRLHLAVLLGLTGLTLLAIKCWREGAMAVALALAAYTVTPGTTLNQLVGTHAQATPVNADLPHYRLLQFNARYDNATPEAFLSLVGQQRPDMITMQEVSANWRAKLEPLAAAYPHQIICDPPSRIGGVAILSRRPFVVGSTPACHDRGMLAIASVDFGGLPVDIAAVHLLWPWPFEQPQQVERLTGYLTGLSDAAILAGDFNAARWSETVRRLSAAASVSDAGPAGPSWLSGHLPISIIRFAGIGIDHVLAGRSIMAHKVERLPPAGSDHLPLLLEFSVQPKARQREIAGSQRGTVQINS